jgi:hypothetical protein
MHALATHAHRARALRTPQVPVNSPHTLSLASRARCAPASALSRQILSRYATVGDYVLFRNFDFATEPVAVDEETTADADAVAASADAPASTSAAPASPPPPPRATRLVAVPPRGFTRAVRWAPNDFPYAMHAGMEHFLVWCAGGALSAEELAEQVEAHRPAAHFEAITFVNPARLQSVRNVWHAHVVCRPRQDGAAAAAT